MRIFSFFETVSEKKIPMNPDRKYTINNSIFYVISDKIKYKEWKNIPKQIQEYPILIGGKAKSPMI